MKTITNPQSIFGGRTFKVSALDLVSFKPNFDADSRPHRAGGIEVRSSFGGGGCFCQAFGEL